MIFDQESSVWLKNAWCRTLLVGEYQQGMQHLHASHHEAMTQVTGTCVWPYLLGNTKTSRVCSACVESCLEAMRHASRHLSLIRKLQAHGVGPRLLGNTDTSRASSACLEAAGDK